jgi:hypothetical protein
MFTRIAGDWYAYYGTLYKMASEQPGVKDLFKSIASFASSTLVLKTHGQQKGYILTSAMAKDWEGSCIKLYSEWSQEARGSGRSDFERAHYDGLSNL